MHQIPSTPRSFETYKQAKQPSHETLADCFAARNQTFETYYGLVAEAVRRTVPSPCNLHRDDAWQEAACALVELSARVELAPDINFAPYALTAMVRRVRRFLATHGSPVHSERFGRNYRRLAGVLRDSPDATAAELAMATGLPDTTIRRVRRWVESATTPEGMAPPCDDCGDAVMAAEASDFRAQLESLIAELGPIDRYLIVRTFGLDGADNWSVPAVAGVLGITRQAALRRLKRCIERLRAQWQE